MAKKTQVDLFAEHFAKDKSIENPRATAIRHLLFGTGDWHLEQLCHLEDGQLIRLEQLVKGEPK